MFSPGDLITNASPVNLWPYRPVGVWSHGNITLTSCSGQGIHMQPTNSLIYIFLGIGADVRTMYGDDARYRMIVFTGSAIIDVASDVISAFVPMTSVRSTNGTR